MKAIILSIALLVSPIFAFSQTASTSRANQFYLGLQPGLNMTQFKDDENDRDYAFRPYLGLTGTQYFNNWFSLEAIALYSLKGSSVERPLLKSSAQYLDLAVVTKVNIVPTIALYLGPSYAYLVNTGEQAVDKDFESGSSFLMGLEFRLQDNVDFRVSYGAPMYNVSPNFQFGINIKLNHRARRSISYRTIRKQAALRDITKLRDSALLVRLKTSENAIRALEDRNQMELAEKIKERQQRENRQIVKAFKSNFDFCPVYFFTSDYSAQVQEKAFDGIFRNELLQLDSAIKLDTALTYYVAEFGNIEPDTSKFVRRDGLSYIDGSELKQTVRRYNSSSMERSFYVLRILNQDFQQLSDPFPYYSRAIFHAAEESPEAMLFAWPIYLTSGWSYDATIRNINRDLHRFYQSDH